MRFSEPFDDVWNERTGGNHDRHATVSALETLSGKTLYAVQNQLNQIGVASLSNDLASGDIGDPITAPAFDVPTTAAAFDSSLYAVNAKFGTPPAGTQYEVVRASRN